MECIYLAPAGKHSRSFKLPLPPSLYIATIRPIFRSREPAFRCIFFAEAKAFRKKDAAAIRARQTGFYEKAGFDDIIRRFLLSKFIRHYI